MMASLYLLLPLSVLFVLGIGVAFWWAIFSGQFDDVQAAGESVLHDDDRTTSPECQAKAERAGARHDN